MIKIFLTFYILTTATFAKAPEIKIYHFGGLQVAFVKIDGFLVNKGCLQTECEALKKARVFKGTEVSVELLEGGKNPSAVRCKEVMGGRVLIGQDSNENSQSFCHFTKDDSFLL